MMGLVFSKKFKEACCWLQSGFQKKTIIHHSSLNPINIQEKHGVRQVLKDPLKSKCIF